MKEAIINNVQYIASVPHDCLDGLARNGFSVWSENLRTGAFEYILELNDDRLHRCHSMDETDYADAWTCSGDTCVPPVFV